MHDEVSEQQSPTTQPESEERTPKDGMLQSATPSEATARAQKQEAGLQLQAVRNLSASSVEKPGTPPRLTSPKSPQPASSAAAHEATRKDAAAETLRSMAPQVEPVQQSPANGVEQDVPEASQDLPGIGSTPASQMQSLAVFVRPPCSL